MQEPVTTIIARRIKPGLEPQYEDWVHRIIDVGSRWPGHQSVDIIRPAQGTHGAYVLLVRFDTLEHQQSWEHSEERAAFLVELEPLTDGDTTFEAVTGLETWFTLPGEAPLPPPNKHKMALILMLTVFTLVLAMNLTFEQQLAQLDVVTRTALLASVQVALLTYVIMPRLTRWLRNWLYPKVD